MPEPNEPNEEVIEPQEPVQEEPGTGEEPEPQEPEGGEEEPEISEDPVEEPGGEEEEEPVSPRESKRIQKLLDKLAERDQRVADSRTKVPQGQQRQPQQPGSQIIPEGEYDLEEINGMARQYAEGEFNRGLTQAQAFTIANTFSTRMEIESTRVNDKYHFLDPESDEFDQGAAGFVNRMYLNTVGYDPQTGVVQDLDVRYGEFVDGFMELVDLIANGKVADTTKGIARQRAQSGVRPSGARKPAYSGSNPGQMSDEELDKAIASGLGIRPA